MHLFSTMSPKRFFASLSVSSKESSLPSTSSVAHPDFLASWMSHFSSPRILSKTIVIFKRLLAPVLFGDLGRLERDLGLADRGYLVLGAAFLALDYLADDGVFWDRYVCVAFFALCYHLLTSTSFSPTCFLRRPSASFSKLLALDI